jgi:hypothetical protein
VGLEPKTFDDFPLTGVVQGVPERVVVRCGTVTIDTDRKQGPFLLVDIDGRPVPVRRVTFDYHKGREVIRLDVVPVQVQEPAA